MPNILRFFILLVAMSLVGCGATLPKVKPYKLDIQQGNVVTSEMLLKLRPGMTKSQVKFIMGTPLLVDSFRTNRWDYFYQLRKQGKVVNQRRVILDFDNDLLKGVRGDVVAKGATAEDVANQVKQEAEGQEAKSADVEEESAESSGLVVTPVEAPVIEAAEDVSEATPDSTGIVEGANVPASVLAVPIAVEPVVNTVESAPVEKLEEKVTADQMLAPEAPEIDIAAVPAVEPRTEILKKVPEEGSVKAKGAELIVMPATVDTNKRVFRIDRSLDASRIIPMEVSASEAPLQDSVVQELKDSQDQPAVITDAPSFFERMLEKIGF